MTADVRQQWGATFDVKVGGSALPQDLQPLMSYAFVEDNLNLPDLCYLSFLDPDRIVVEKAGLAVGATLEVGVRSERYPSGLPVFTGEVTALETEFEGGRTRTVVRGFDKAHRLSRGRRTRAFKDVKYSDVVKQVTQQAGLQAGRVEDPPGRPVRHLAQPNLTDTEFLTMLAGEVGFVLSVDDGKVNFHPPPKSGDAPSAGNLDADDPFQLIQGDNLLRFNATVTADAQVEEVSVRGWDIAEKRALVGTAPAETLAAQIGVTPAELAQPFGSPPLTAIDVPYGEQGQVDAAARALAEQVAGVHAQLEGVVRGNPELLAGKAVSLGLAGEPFDGKYTLTASRHVFDNGEYLTHISCTGRHERSLQSLTSGGGSTATVSPAFVGAPIPGVVSALVTNVKDEDGLGQVKVRIPRLDDEFESEWMRVVQAGAGAGRGAIVLPEVDDEVLVAFEHGDMRRGYVLGGLYNGRDQPDPTAYDGAVGAEGRVDKRSFTTRKGHFLLLSDADGDEYLEVATKGSKHALKLAKDQDGGLVLLASDNLVRVDAKGDITIAGKGKVTVDASGDMALTGRKVSISAQSDVEVSGLNVKISGRAQAQLAGAQTAVKADTMLDLNGGQMANLHATLVKIN